MNLILTMAGIYQRFAKEGYKIPKYLLPWGEKTILSSILDCLDVNKAFKNVILIANARDHVYAPHILATLRSFGLSESNLLMIDGSSGQAESAVMGMNALYKMCPAANDQSVLIHNIDTILLGRNFPEIKNILTECDGYIDVFSSTNHSYSYVLLNDTNQVIDIAEKMVISNLATSGLYGFRSPAIFEYFYRADDIYIASIYKRMVEQERKIVVGDIHKEIDTIVLGTPFDYLNASATFFK
jgi:NDP-sugar pyrophosphorylase family protein